MAFFIFNRHNSYGFMRSSYSIYFLYFFVTLMLGSCTESVLFKAVPYTSSGIVFENRITETETFNILTEEYIFNGGGVAIADFNKDGLPDLFFSGNQVNNALYLNDGGLKFTDVSAASGVASVDRWFTGVLILDVNNDTWPDIYVAAGIDDDPVKRQNALFVHKGLNEQGIPIFEEQAEAYGIADGHSSMWAASLDYNADGLIDLYVLNNEQTGILPTNYREKVLDGSAQSNDRLYRNNGDGSFTDVTLEAGIRYEGFGLGVVVSDINYDGYDDIYVTNDYLTNDLLYINDTKGAFTNEIGHRLKHQSKFSMGVDVNDINNDGLLDILSVDMLAETNQRMKTTVMGVNYISEVYNKRWGYEPQYMRNMLQLANGADLPFSEVGLLSGIARTDWSWSPLMADMDNDGLRDVLITNGFPRDVTDMDFSNYRLENGQYARVDMILDSVPVVKIPNYAYRNLGNLQFEDVGESWGLNSASFSNGAVYSDLDLDGDLDYIVNNINDRAFLFENRTNEMRPANNHLQIELKGPKENHLAIGAKVWVKTQSSELYTEQRLGRGYMSSVDPVLHFGLGSHNEALEVVVIWPDGKSERLQNIRPNKRIQVDYESATNDPSLLAQMRSRHKSERTLFEEVSQQTGLIYTHEEADIIDFSAQHLLPYKISQNGPVLSTADFNGDGLEDILVGSSAGYSPVLFIQNADGQFEPRPLYTDERLLHFEEARVIAFDLENDGDLDLFMASGGGDYKAPKAVFDQVLLINDGAGNFTRSTDRLPLLTLNASTAEPLDFNNDGFTDIFIGGGVIPGQYPRHYESVLLENRDGRLIDVTDSIFPGLKELGSVNDAKWFDLDNDGYLDLIVAGHYKPIEIFLHTSDGYLRHNTSIEDKLGWFNTIEVGDFNNDGRPDIIAGNLGRNNFYQASAERPLSLLAKDFDDNGSIDPVLFAYFKGKEGQYAQYPVAFWGDVNKQSPLFRGKFNFYAEYGQADAQTLFTEEERAGAIEYTMNYDRSVLFLNTGETDFVAQELPIEAQFAPINDIIIEDLDNDGNLDALLIGNNYGNEVFIGHLDALNGLVLLGDGSGQFTVLPAAKSGFLVEHDAKHLETVKTADGSLLYLATQNRDRLRVFRKN
jgi:enediyne biosynthesis protein E4